MPRKRSTTTTSNDNLAGIVGLNLDRLIATRKTTVLELSKASGVSTANIYAWIRGDRSRICECIGQLATHYRMKPDTLLKGSTSAETFGERLKEVREARNRSIIEVAQSTGILRNYLYQLERAQAQKALSVVWKLAEALRVKPSSLFKS